MPKNKMVTKHCPECEQQVPVACKNCPCGHVFFTARRAVGLSKSGAKVDPDDAAGEGSEGVIKRRRTERIRRERPNYFGTTTQHLENRIKTLKRKAAKPRTSSSTNDMEGDQSEDNMSQSTNKKPRGRPPKNAGKNTDKSTEKQIPEKEEELLANISTERSLQLSIVLAEINRKMGAQQFKIP